MAPTELSAIRGRHRGQCIAVLGGGPTLLADLKRVPFDTILIGVNQHAMLMNLDYLVFEDRDIYPVVRESDAPLCTSHRDLAHIYTGIAPGYGLSGATATWIADNFEASQIILAGMDNYSGGRRYWHSPPQWKGDSLGCSCISVWQQVHRQLERPERVRAISGPLTEVFGTL